MVEDVGDAHRPRLDAVHHLLVPGPGVAQEHPHPLAGEALGQLGGAGQFRGDGDPGDDAPGGVLDPAVEGVAGQPQPLLRDLVPLPARGEEGALQVDAGDLGAVHLLFGAADGGGGLQGILLAAAADGGQEGGDPVGGAEVPQHPDLPGLGNGVEGKAHGPVEVGVDQARDSQHPVAVDDPAVGVPRGQDALDPPLADAQVAAPDLALQHSPDVDDGGDDTRHKFPFPEGLGPRLNVNFP